MLSTLEYETEKFTSDQAEFACINLTSRSILALYQFPQKLLFISYLYLDNNLLKSLNGISQFMNLEVLSVNFNFISQKLELSKIRNKFLMKELSIIGNEIEKKVDFDWLNKEGFTKLENLNNVASIGSIIRSVEEANLLKFQLNSQRNRKSRHNFSNSSIHQTNQSPPSNSKSIKSNNKHHAKQRVQQFLQTQDRLKYLESTHHSSKTKAKARIQQQFQSATDRQLSQQKRAINQFKLFPVSQQAEQEHQSKATSNLFNSRYVTNRGKKGKYPFEQTRETNEDEEEDDQGYVPKQFASKVRSFSKHQRSPQKASNLPNYQQQYQNNEFPSIQSQIPIYKQAIAVAYYYRNLLEKVFKGFKLVTNYDEVDKQQTDIEADEAQLMSRKQQTLGLIKSNKEGGNQERLNQRDKLKWAWMKLEFHLAQQRIKQKYKDYCQQ